MNKKSKIAQKILGALTLVSGVFLVYFSISLIFIGILVGIFNILLIIPAVMTIVSGSKLYNATTYDRLRSKVVLSVMIIISSFAAPLLLLNSGNNGVIIGIAIVFFIILFIAPSILLRLLTKK